MKLVSFVYLIGILSVGLIASGCQSKSKLAESQQLVDTLIIKSDKGSMNLELEFARGEAHNHPSFAIWVEDTEGNYLSTLYVTKSIGTGIFNYGPGSNGETWVPKPGWQKRPASLPYWLHKRSASLNLTLLPTPEKPVTDAYTGATPVGDFRYRFDRSVDASKPFRVLVEINQPWDWNEYWVNGKYDNPDYRTSCQPSLVYAVTVHPEDLGNRLYLNPIGHGHHSGENGILYTDLRTFTTALDIVDYISVTLIK